MNELLAQYLSTKKVHTFRGKSYYKVKDYKSSYFIDKTIIERLSSGPKEVTLEKNALTSPVKGMVKWDNMQKKILISESKVQLLYKPFTVL